ncbi:MAG TPA: hypothetical protein VFZ35_04235 [Sphingomicrobium sp.]
MAIRQPNGLPRRRFPISQDAMTLTNTLARLIELTEKHAEGRPSNFPLGPNSAISQDAYIFGIDLDDYVQKLHEEFGPIILEIPWLNYTDQSDSYRGCAVAMFPFILLGRLVAQPITRRPLLRRPNPKAFPDRLELAHVAKVIDQGYWEEP